MLHPSSKPLDARLIGRRQIQTLMSPQSTMRSRCRTTCHQWPPTSRKPCQRRGRGLEFIRINAECPSRSSTVVSFRPSDIHQNGWAGATRAEMNTAASLYGANPEKDPLNPENAAGKRLPTQFRGRILQSIDAASPDQTMMVSKTDAIHDNRGTSSRNHSRHGHTTTQPDSR